MAFAFDEYLTADDISIFSHVHQWLGNFFEFDCFSTTFPPQTHPPHCHETDPRTVLAQSRVAIEE